MFHELILLDRIVNAFFSMKSTENTTSDPATAPVIKEPKVLKARSLR